MNSRMYCEGDLALANKVSVFEEMMRGTPVWRHRTSGRTITFPMSC